MMLKALATDVAHKLLQIRDLRNGPGAESIQGIIRKLAFANIGADNAVCIGGSDTAKGERSSLRTTFQCAVGVFDSEDASKNRGVSDLDVGQKTLGPISAMKKHALVIVVTVIVVPIHQGGGRPR